MKKIGKDDALPRHEAIIALKEIAASRQDPYLANEIEIWIQKFVVQFGSQTSSSKELLSFVKDPVDYLDHIKKKGLVEIGASAANLTAEIFEMMDEKKEVHHMRFRMLGLRHCSSEDSSK